MSKIKIRFFTIADYEDEEIWLRNCSKNGLKMKKYILPCFYVFEECTPQDVVYRLDYKNNTQNEDYMQMCRDYGWESFQNKMGWIYFRKSASQIHSENDAEIFSDEASKLDMIQSIVKTRMLPLLLVFFSCVFPNWCRAIDGELESTGKILSIFFTVMLILYLFLFLYCGLKLRRLKKKYQKK